MEFIHKKLTTDSGAVAAYWFPTMVSIKDVDTATVALGGKVQKDAEVFVAALEIDVEIDDVHVYRSMIDGVEDKMRSDVDSVLRGAYPVRIRNKTGMYLKKDIKLRNGLNASIWERTGFALDMEGDIAYATFSGFRKIESVEAGEAPATGRVPYRVVVRPLRAMPKYPDAHRSLLKHLTKTRGFELCGGKIGRID